MDVECQKLRKEYVFFYNLNPVARNGRRTSKTEEKYDFHIKLSTALREMDVEHCDFGVCVGKQMCANNRLVGYGVGKKLCC